MANNDVLTSLLLASQTGANPEDIIAFQNNATKGSVYNQIAVPVAGMQFDASSWSPTQKLGTSALQSFISSALQSLGEKDVANQLSTVASVAPNLYSNPLSVSVPAGVNESAFNALKLSSMARQAQAKSALSTKLMQDLFGINIAGETEKAKIQGQLEAYNNSSNGNENLLNPLNKEAATFTTGLRKELLGNPNLRGFDVVKNSINILANAMTDTRAISDLDYIYGVAKILDPNSVVRESEAGMVIDSNSIPNTTLGYLNKMLHAGGALDLAQRKAIFDLASRHFNTLSEKAKTTQKLYIDMAKRKGADPLDVTVYTDTDFNLPTLDIKSIASMLAKEGKSEDEISKYLRKNFNNG